MATLEATPGDYQPLTPQGLFQAYESYRSDRRDHGRTGRGESSHGWFSKWYRHRTNNRKTVYNIITGELGAAKTTSAYLIGKWFFRRMSPEYAVFWGSDYQRTVRKLDLLYRAGALRWGEAEVQYEEANLTIGARDFSRVVNKQVTGFAQGTRSLGVNANFPMPADLLVDCNIVRVAQIKTRITGRNDDYAWGVVHRIKPNEFGTSPRYFYPKLGTLKFKNPYKDKVLAAELDMIEDMKQKFLGVLFDSDKLQLDEQEIIRKNVKKTPDQEYHINYVLQHPDDFGWDPDAINKDGSKGSFSFKDIQAGPKGEWALGATSTSRIKNVAEKRMKNAARVETIPLPGEQQPPPSQVQEEPLEANLGD